MGASSSITLQLEDITEYDIPGVTKIQASQHLEACLICFDKHKHQCGIELAVKPNVDKVVLLEWVGTVTEQMRRSWNDLQEATEYGATAVAILLVLNFTEYTIIERAAKGMGFDYWLMEDNLYEASDEVYPAGTARLEVSGIIHAEKDSEIKRRVKVKEKQTSVSDELCFPAVIVVVEFSRPEAHMVYRP